MAALQGSGGGGGGGGGSGGGGGGGSGGGGGGGRPRALRLSPSTVEFWAVPLAFAAADDSSPGVTPPASLGQLLATDAEVCGENIYHGYAYYGST